jgi:murein DD-endopeptidase MepM/ murein hydrolase activator NlpD
MSGFPPSSRVPRRLRVSAFGLAAACTVGLAAPAVAAVAATPARPATVANAPVANVAGLPGADDPDKAKKKVDQQIQDLKDELEDTSADLKNAYFALRKTQAALPGAQANLDKAQAAVAKADAYNDEMAIKLQVAQANEAKAVDELASAKKDAVDSRNRVAQFASQLYQDQGMGQLSVALNATTPDDFASRMAMNDTVMDVQQQTLSKLATAQAAATAQEAHIRALRQQVAEAKKAAEVALASAQTARTKAAAAKAKLDQLAAQQTAQSKALEDKKAAEKGKLDAAQKEQARLQAVLKERARKAKLAAARAAAAARKAGKPAPRPQSAPSSGGFLSFPVNAPVSSEFGMRFHPILHYWRLHAGRDFAANCGTPIRAAASGTVISAGWAGGYGNRIEIDHGIVRGVNLVTAYNHMSGYAVRGGKVSRGQVIGYVGTTGSSTGCHLHFETYEDGVPKDPRRWM